MSILLIPILIPFITGLIVLVIPRMRGVREGIALIGMLIALVASIGIFRSEGLKLSYNWLELGGLTLSIDLVADTLSSFIVMFISLFGVLLTLYSFSYIRRFTRNREYYSYLLWTVAGACGAVLADNLLFLLVCWEVVTLMLFLLITMGNGRSPLGAAKTFGMIGAADCALLLGIAFLGAREGTISISGLTVPLDTAFPIIAFLLMMVGALTKAGAMPFHSWIPTAAEGAPTSVMAFLPASLDKLLGIYLLARLTLDIFALKPLSAMSYVLMIIGAITVVLAVMQALVQHDLRKLLSFHAVSQVGYMVLGIGTAVPIGIIGGLFHMLNNAIYKCCLFLSAGTAEHRTGKVELAELGGLARAMPVTFVATVIAALSISGVPPFNGFVSKWMVYQGTIEMESRAGMIFLVAAMFGSALTLASFIKVLYSVFLGQKPKEIGEVKRAPFVMALPMVVLAILCVLFGVAAQLPYNHFFAGVLGESQLSFTESMSFPKAIWGPGLATVLLIIGLILGVIIYLFGKVSGYRTTDTFVGGEKLDTEDTRVPGTDFYETIRLLRVLKTIYEDSKEGVYDLYSLVGKYGLNIVSIGRRLHNGRLPTYLAWCIIGLAVLLVVLLT